MTAAPVRTHAPTVLRVGAVLADMDGTLVDSSRVVERTWRWFAARHGLDPEVVLADAHGRPTRDTVARHLPAGVDVDAQARLLRDRECEDLDGVRAMPGAADFLDALPPGRWAVVTSADGRLARRRLAAAGLPEPAVLVTADDVALGKPDPEGYLLAAARIDGALTDAAVAGSCAAAPVVLEDADAGVRAGLAAGAAVVVIGDAPVPGGVTLPHVPDLTGLRVTADATDPGVLHLWVPAASGR